jgi:hypothetical protein
MFEFDLNWILANNSNSLTFRSLFPVLFFVFGKMIISALTVMTTIKFKSIRFIHWIVIHRSEKREELFERDRSSFIQFLDGSSEAAPIGRTICSLLSKETQIFAVARILDENKIKQSLWSGVDRGDFLHSTLRETLNKWECRPNNDQRIGISHSDRFRMSANFIRVKNCPSAHQVLTVAIVTSLHKSILNDAIWCQTYGIPSITGNSKIVVAVESGDPYLPLSSAIVQNHGPSQAIILKSEENNLRPCRNNHYQALLQVSILISVLIYECQQSSISHCLAIPNCVSDFHQCHVIIGIFWQMQQTETRQCCW